MGVASKTREGTGRRAWARTGECCGVERVALDGGTRERRGSNKKSKQIKKEERRTVDLNQDQVLTSSLATLTICVVSNRVEDR